MSLRTISPAETSVPAIVTTVRQLVQHGHGTVTGPASSTAGHLATFADATGKLLLDGGVPFAGPGSSIAGNVPTFADVTGKLLQDSGLQLSAAQQGMFGTRTLAAAATIPASVTFLRTFGYATAGDWGGALYIKVGGTTPGGFQSADGQWWQIAETTVTPQMFGGFPGGACSTPIQNAIACLLRLGGGIVFFPSPGSYIATSIVVSGAVRLIACSRTAVVIDGSASNANTITFDPTCTYASLESITVLGYANAAATSNAVTIAQGVAVVIRDCGIFGGSSGLFTQGVDGLVANSFIQGYTTCVTSNGANWYERVKLDTGALAGGATATAGFLQGNYYTAGVGENSFIDCDFTGNYTNSVKIDDAGTASAITKFGSGCVFSQPIRILNAKVSMFTGGCEFGSTTFIVGTNPTIIDGCYAFAATVVSGAGKVLGTNINIT